MRYCPSGCEGSGRSCYCLIRKLQNELSVLEKEVRRLKRESRKPSPDPSPDPTQTCHDTICVREIDGVPSLDLENIQLNNLYTTASDDQAAFVDRSLKAATPHKYRSNILAGLSVRNRAGDYELHAPIPPPPHFSLDASSHGTFYYRRFNLQFSTYSKEYHNFHTDRWVLNLYQWVARNNYLISQHNHPIWSKKSQVYYDHIISTSDVYLPVGTYYIEQRITKSYCYKDSEDNPASLCTSIYTRAPQSGEFHAHFPTTERFALKELYRLLGEGEWSMEWIHGDRFTYGTAPATPHPGYMYITSSKAGTALDTTADCDISFCPSSGSIVSGVSTTYSDIASLYIPYHRDKSVTSIENLWFFYLNTLLTGNYLETVGLI